MIRVVAIVFISLCVCGPLVATNAQAPRSDRSNVLQQLLDKPAPRPLSGRNETEPSRERPDEFYDKDKQPSDDAPIEDLIDYWSRYREQPDRAPTEVVKQRLLDASLADPQMVAKFIYLFPENEAAAAKIKGVYDKIHNEGASDARQIIIKDWLLYNSKFFINELVASANKVKDDGPSGYVDNMGALTALAQLNWELAEPLLRNLLASTQLRSAAVANALYYQHAIREKDSAAEERYRKSLKAIASDLNQPGFARDIAIQMLSKTEWSGRDEWYLGLFHDNTLLRVRDGSNTSYPLTTMFASDPDKWIPIMTRLVEGKDVPVRSAAAACLLSIETKNARRDALLPLLPWLSDPNWANDGGSDRLQLIQTVGAFDIPESTPGLIWTVENDASDVKRAHAAAALAKYKDRRAVPALRKALSQEKVLDHRRLIIAGLIASDGFTDAELLEALEAYATKCTTEAGRQEIDRYLSSDEETLSIPLTVGDYLNGQAGVSESLVQAVFTRADELRSTNLPVAQSLLKIAHRWQGRQIDLDVINRIANESADAEMIVRALQQRSELRTTVRPEMYSVSGTSGAAQGIAAALLEDPTVIQNVLGSDDQLAQVALLACGRLIRASLPVNLVGPLLRSRNSLLALAAKSYLLLEDSREAREFLWKHHPNQAFVTGWGENGDVEPRYLAMIKIEEKFRAELFKENGPVEILAWVRPEELSSVLRIYRDKAVFTDYDDPARYRERVISQSELAAFKQFLTTKGVAESGPQLLLCGGCPADEFLSLTKEKGRRVYVENHNDHWVEVEKRFRQLAEGARIHYHLEKHVKGLEVLIADEHLIVQDVWQQGDEVRMLVEQAIAEEARTRSTVDDSDDESEAVKLEYWRQETARRSARFSWRVYTNKKVGAVTSQPAIYSTIDEIKFPPFEDFEAFRLNDDPNVRRINADSILISRNVFGLWKQVAGTKGVRIASGAYFTPVVTPDGKWVVVPKAENYFTGPRYIVRFNLQTGREFRVNLERASAFEAVAFLPTHGKVLLRRAKNLAQESSVGPDRVEYYLLDPSTGDTRLVSGEFEPLHHRGHRFLQPTDKPNEFWAAISRGEKKETQVGRYNLKDFTFTPVLTVPEIPFNSLSMWVDEGRQQIYLVYQDQLLRLPLEAQR